MNTPLHDLIERLFAAVEAKDLDAFLQCIAEDAVFIDPHYPSPAMIGKAAITDGLRWGFGGMKQFGFKIETYFEQADGQRAVIEVATHHVLPTGAHVQFPQAFFIDVQNNLVTRLQAYEPYGPHGMVSLIVGIARLQRRLKGQHIRRIGNTPGTAKP